MYSLKEVPTLLYFLKKLIKTVDKKYKFIQNIEKDFYLVNICKCGQKNCATFYLRRRLPLREQPYLENSINTNKGMINIHLYESEIDNYEYIELEVIGYMKFPYKDEIVEFFKKEKSSHCSSPKKITNSKKLTIKNKKKVDKYFNLLNRTSLYEIKIQCKL